MLKVLDNEVATEEQAEGPTLDELAREGARRMLMKALAVEVAQYVVGDREKVSVSESRSSGVIVELRQGGCRVRGYGTDVGGCAAAG